MENNPNSSFSPQSAPQPLPNSTVSLVLGIISIIGCCGYGVVGLVLGIIAIILANKDEKLYRLNMAAYTASSYNNTKAGKVCGIIGVIIGSLYLILILFVLAMFGFAVMTNPAALRDALQNMH